MKLDLPPMGRRPDAEAHTYPFRIGLQASEFIQAAIFLTAFRDEAAGLTVRSTGGLRRVEQQLGLDPASDISAQAWKYLEKYKAVFSKHVFQYTLITMRSHWDWYVSRLGVFVEFCRDHVPSPRLSNTEKQRLGRIGFRPIGEQAELLSKATGITFGFKPETIEQAKEMSRVRNLGVHNRWEVDAYYRANHSSSRAWEVGELREFDAEELQRWHAALVELVNVTGIEVAKVYRDAPDFDARAPG